LIVLFILILILIVIVIIIKHEIIQRESSMDPTHVRCHFPTLLYCWSLLPQWLRPRLRLSVLALMLLVLILGGGFGWVVHRARVQRDAVAAIEGAGGSVRYELFTLSSKNYKFETPQWLLSHLGADYVGTVKAVYLSGPIQQVRGGRSWSRQKTQSTPTW